LQQTLKNLKESYEPRAQDMYDMYIV
jgi:hypothetical protein